MLRKTILRQAGNLLWIVFVFDAAAQSAMAVSLEWTRQLGTAADDRSAGVSADGQGNVYTSGATYGSLGGPNAGGSDAFLAKYDAAGGLQWTRQLGNSKDEEPDFGGVSADGLGNVYISGSAFGSLGGTGAGSKDAFVAKYDAAGSLQWTKQLGTSSPEISYGVSADRLGNVYISGATFGSLGGPNAGDYDAFVAKYDAAGTPQWTKQLGTSAFDASYGVSADGLGNVYISGTTQGSLGGPNAGGNDAYVAKYDAAGNLQWTRQLGTSASDKNYGVSADGLGNVYITGETEFTPGVAGFYAFIAKYDAAGSPQWTKQLHSNGEVTPKAISADGQGNVYISGQTNGSLGGPNAGNLDAFVANYDAAGSLQWTKQLGTSAWDSSNGISANGLGNIYLSGYTNGSLGGPNVGGVDAFVTKYSDSSALLADINGDGIVDAGDYVSWRKTGGTAADYNTWRQNFGATAAGAAAAAHSDFRTVPEPRGLGIYWSTLVALFGLRGVTGRKRYTDSRNFDNSLSCAIEILSALWLRLRLSG